MPIQTVQYYSNHNDITIYSNYETPVSQVNRSAPILPIHCAVVRVTFLLRTSHLV